MTGTARCQHGERIDADGYSECYFCLVDDYYDSGAYDQEQRYRSEYDEQMRREYESAQWEAFWYGVVLDRCLLEDGDSDATPD